MGLLAEDLQWQGAKRQLERSEEHWRDQLKRFWVLTSGVHLGRVNRETRRLHLLSPRPTRHKKPE